MGHGHGFLFIPLCLLCYLPAHKLNWQAWRLALTGMLLLMALILTATNVGGPYWNGRGKRVHYPAQEIAGYVEQQWRQSYPQMPLPFVAGSKHMASLVSFYAPSRPSAILDTDWQDSFWVTAQDFAARGGAIVWTIDDSRHEGRPPPGICG